MNATRSGRSAGAADLSVEDVSISYGQKAARFTAVKDVSFAIGAGERYAIIGPSGCGKTTLLMAVAGFLPPASGVIRSGGTEITGPGPDRAVVFQDFDQLFPWRTIHRNLTYALRVTGRAKGARAEEIAEEYLGLVRIADAGERYPHQLSGGMKMRAALARALAIQPCVLLMDEPFGAVDEITRTALQRELDRICRATNVTLVMVTHSIQEAAYLGDRVVVMTTNPGSVRTVVDTSAVTDLDSPAFTDAVADLRALLDGAAAASHASGERADTPASIGDRS